MSCYVVYIMYMNGANSYTELLLQAILWPNIMQCSWKQNPSEESWEPKILIMNPRIHEKTLCSNSINQIFLLSLRQHWSYRITPISLLHIRLAVDREELPRLLRFGRFLFNKASKFWKHFKGLTCRCYKEQATSINVTIPQNVQ